MVQNAAFQAKGRIDVAPILRAEGIRRRAVAKGCEALVVQGTRRRAVRWRVAEGGDADAGIEAAGGGYQIGRDAWALRVAVGKAALPEAAEDAQEHGDARSCARPAQNDLHEFVSQLFDFG